MGIVRNKLTKMQNQLFMDESELLTDFSRHLNSYPLKENVEIKGRGNSVHFESKDLFALYLGCGNPLTLKLNEGDDYSSLSYSCKGGKLRKGKKIGEVIIYPSSKQVVITVNNNGKRIGEGIFKVRKIPLPTIEIRPDGRKMTAVQERVGLKEPPRSISVVAVPAMGFKSVLPSEAKYLVTK